MGQFEIEKLFVEKFAKFTKPQQAIITRFLAGDKLTVVNRHLMNGGEWRWITTSSKYLEHAGHVSKAYQGIFWTVKKLTGLDVDLAKFYIVL